MKTRNRLFAVIASFLMLAAPTTILVDSMSDADSILTMHIYYDGVEKQTCKIGEKITAITPSPRTGYEFNYWISDTGEHFAAGASIDTTLMYAKLTSMNLYFVSDWSAVKYTVKFMNDGELLKTITVKYGASCGTLPSVSKEGYSLVGWSYNGETSGLLTPSSYNIPNDCTLYPLWKPNSYNVSLYDGDSLVTTVSCDYGSKFPELPTLTTEGYSFMGWSFNREGTLMIDDTTIYETVGDSEIYAIWAPKSFNVTFYDDGAEVGSTKMQYMSEMGELPTLTKKGMTFVGWSYDGTVYGLVGEKTVFDRMADTKLYAVWVTNEYNVRFDAHGGELSFDSKKIEYGSVIGEFPQCTKSGSTLRGWSLTEDGTTMIDANTPILQDSDIVVHAIWDDDVVTPSGGPTGSFLTDPVTLGILGLIIIATIGVSVYIYKRGLL